MKSKTLIVTLLGCLVWQQAVLSQTDTTATNPPATGAVAPASQPAGAPDTNSVASPAAPDSSVAAAASTNESASVTSSNETASASTAPASIPLIQFQDVPITTAIENLARQAGINYLLDPKIGYGQPDANGQVKAEPTISIRWENITAAQALLELLDNYGLQLVEDHKTQIAHITTKDPSAPAPLTTRVVQLKYASVQNMVAATQAALSDKRSKVLPDVRTSQLIVVATDSEQEAVDTLVNQLDKPTRQVLIETKLVEISSNPNTKKGIDWSKTLAGQNVTFGNNVLGGQSGNPYSQTAAGTIDPVMGGVVTTTYGANNLVDPTSLLVDTAHGFNPTTGFLNADGVHAVLSFLNASSDAQVVSTPRVVTLDNETATISVTRGYPVINVVASTLNVSGGSSITYSNIGTILEVTPRISANDYIWLKVVPDVSSFFGVHQQTIANQTYTADIFDSRHIETQVLIPNSNTLVMGGMVKDNPNSQYTKVPVLGDIPFLGYAFRSENKSLDKDNLLIFITPTIIKDADFQPTTTAFLQSQPHQMKTTLHGNSMWDSAKPRDWSNPKMTDPTLNTLDAPSAQ